MTSSLVGSEMCIRDSRVFRAAGNTELTTADRCTSPLGGGELRAEAVSYTHLTLPTICSV
eukprot:9971755-Prorocentrum_lima.AAC.1